jgi:ankyrin repeat protein
VIKDDHFLLNPVYRPVMEDEEIVSEQVILSYLIKDDVNSLRHQISIGLDVNQQFFWILGDLPDILTNSPPLISVAAFYNAVNCFTFLLDNNADIAKLDELDTPLVNFAVAGGTMEIIEKLNDRGVNFRNTLQIAAEYGHYELFMWLLRNQELDIYEVDKYSRNFLHIAASGGNCQLVQFLIVQGLDVNGIDGSGWTPLHFAVEKRRLDVVRVLLANERINVNCRDVIFESSLIMYHAIGNCMPLHHAVHNDDLAMVELLLAAPRIDPNCRDAEGKTPLHIAAAKGNVELVNLLRGHRLVDITIQAHDGRTAAECARKPEIIIAINRGGSRYCIVA